MKTKEKEEYIKKQRRWLLFAELFCFSVVILMSIIWIASFGLNDSIHDLKNFWLGYIAAAVLLFPVYLIHTWVMLKIKDRRQSGPTDT